jgi:hypothetical protein
MPLSTFHNAPASRLLEVSGYGNIVFIAKKRGFTNKVFAIR